MSTIRDVAQRAGVSTMTVSRVINRSGYTSAETRARVERAIAELGYVPNAVARHLRSKVTKSIALVLSDITNPFFTTIARGVEDVAGPRGFGVMFCNTDEDPVEEMDYLQMLTQRQVDGVLLVPAGSATAPLRLLRSRRVPVVVLDRRVRSRQVDQVRTDSVADSRRLVRYGGYGIAGGYQMATEVLALDPPPTALFAANNFIAFGALRRLRELRLHVPEDVSLVCFDDLPEDWLIDPFLTVVDQPAYEMGRRAAELLLRRLDGTPPHAAQSIVLPGELVERRSTAAPSAIPVAVA